MDEHSTHHDHQVVPRARDPDSGAHPNPLEPDHEPRRTLLVCSLSRLVALTYCHVHTSAPRSVTLILLTTRKPPPTGPLPRSFRVSFTQDDCISLSVTNDQRLEHNVA